MSLPEEEAPFGRRPYDRHVPPVVETYVENRLTETRHQLREEFTVALAGLTATLAKLTETVSAANLQSVKDHAEVKAHIERLEDVVRGVPSLEGRVTEIEAEERADDRVVAALEKQSERMERNRAAIRNYAIGLAGLILAVASGLAGLLAH